MRLEAIYTAISQILAVALGVCYGKKIGWDGGPVIDLKLAADVMPRRDEDWA